MAVDPRSKKGIDWDLVPLGQVSDHEIAHELGVSKTSVASARKVRGIPAKPMTDRMRRIAWDMTLSDGTTIPLGRVPDREIARWLGCSLNAVVTARRNRGIPPHRR